MKVIPHIKSRKLATTEVRVITIDQKAVEELLLENLIEKKNEYFDIENSTNDDICIMHWDRTNQRLTYAIMPMERYLAGYQLNIENIYNKVGITTTSLFKPKRYVSLTLTDEYLQKKG